MKQISIVFILMVLIAFQLNAQLDDRAAFQLGFKAGANLSNVYDARGDNFNADAKFGYVAGVFISVPLGNTFGIQPEVLFSQKGFKANGTLLGNPYTLTRTTNFIDVPIYLTIKPMNSLTILLGPQFSYLTQQKDVLETSSSSVEQLQEFKNENIRKNILGASLGVNLNISKVVLGARANWDLYTNHGDGTSTTPRYKNAWLQATIGFRLL